jgi:hypothetical protein
MTARHRRATPEHRPACLPASHSRDGERVLVEPATADGLKVTVRLIAIPEAESNPLRARQLAVIVDLLRRATAEAEREKLAKRSRPAKRG